MGKLPAAIKAFTSRPAVRWSFGLVLGWRALLELVNQALPHIVSPLPTGSSYLGLARWVRWDSGWYLDVVQNGYHHIHIASGQENFAFFPAFPGTVSLLSRLLHLSPVIVALTINTLLTVLVCYFMYGITEQVIARWGGKAAKNKHQLLSVVSVIALLLYPASYFMITFYAEAFLMVGVLGAIYFTLRGKLWRAALCLAVATATKSLGLVALPTAAVITLEQWRAARMPVVDLLKRWFILGTGLAGLAGYAVYLWVRFGDPLLFYKVEKTWGRNVGSPISGIYGRYYAHVLHPSYFGGTYSYLLNLFIMALPFVIIAFTGWVTYAYKTYWPIVLGFLALALPLNTGIMESLNRYELVTAPLLSFAALEFVKAPKLIKLVGFALLILSGTFLCYFAAGFAYGKFGG